MLKIKYNNEHITYINRAAPSSFSDWGIENVSLVTNTHADLVIIALGMNEPQKDGSSFGNNIKTIIDDIRKVKPDTDILLASCMCANQDIECLKNNKFKEQEDVLIRLSAQMDNVAVARVHSVFEAMANAG